MFTSGLNILWGSSDTGKTFLVQAIDFMLGASAKLRDIPERVGYDRILLGITTAAGTDYTLQRSIDVACDPSLGVASVRRRTSTSVVSSWSNRDRLPTVTLSG